MRRIILPFLLLFLNPEVEAQFHLFLQGGSNYTSSKVVQTNYEKDRYALKSGWQAGGRAGYQYKNNLILCGRVILSSSRLSREILSLQEAGERTRIILFF